MVGGDYIIFLVHWKDWLFGSRKWDSKIIDSSARARPVCEHIQFIFNSVHSFRKCVMLWWQQTKIKWASNSVRGGAGRQHRTVCALSQCRACVKCGDRDSADTSSSLQSNEMAILSVCGQHQKMAIVGAVRRLLVLVREETRWWQCSNIYVSMIHVMSVFYRESSSSSVAIVAAYSLRRRRHSHSSAATVI